MANKFKNIQAGVLKAFQEEIPSIYYSDKSKKEFNHWKSVMEFHYHDLMKFPKDMFKGKNLIQPIYKGDYKHVAQLYDLCLIVF